MEREDITTTAFHPVPDCASDSNWVVGKNFVRENKGFISVEKAQDFIVQTRKKFYDSLEVHKGPVIIPTIFKNHSDRMSHIRAENKRLQLSAKNPPNEGTIRLEFAKDVYVNLEMNCSQSFEDGKYRALIKHANYAKVVCLDPQFSAEQAFEELLSRKPLLYSANFEIQKKSAYVDSDKKRWEQENSVPRSVMCRNRLQFVADFSIIFPDAKWSSVFMYCYQCGRFAETVFCDATKETARKEIWQNISESYLGKTQSEQGRFVIRLPCRDLMHQTCSFCEGLMGIVPLAGTSATKPSLFVRVRLTFFVTPLSSILPNIHGSDTYKDLYPNVDELIAKLCLDH